MFFIAATVSAGVVVSVTRPGAAGGGGGGGEFLGDKPPPPPPTTLLPSGSSPRSFRFNFYCRPSNTRSPLQEKEEAVTPATELPGGVAMAAVRGDKTRAPAGSFWHSGLGRWGTAAICWAVPRGLGARGGAGGLCGEQINLWYRVRYHGDARAWQGRRCRRRWWWRRRRRSGGGGGGVGSSSSST